jgi:hypothetical protein
MLATGYELFLEHFFKGLKHSSNPLQVAMKQTKAPDEFSIKIFDIQESDTNRALQAVSSKIRIDQKL